MHAMPGVALSDIMQMTWPDVVAWWNVARGIVEGPDPFEEERSSWRS